MQQQLQFYEVLLRRALCSPPQLSALQSKYRTALAGLAGEKRVLFELTELQLPHTVFHNFNFFNSAKHKVQIDILVVCAHFVLILEVKNISGRIDFDDRRRQLIRTRVNGEQESFMNPVDQVKRHQQFMEQLFLTDTQFIPVEKAIVIANPNTLIGHVSNEVPIFNVSGLRSFIDGLCKKYSHVRLNMRRIQQLLKSHSVEQRFDLSVEPYKVRCGVLCLECGGVMKVRARGFHCATCNLYDANDAALLKAMHDYKILYGPQITNKDFRAFCLINSRVTAYKYLSRLKIEHTGDNRGRLYLLP